MLFIVCIMLLLCEYRISVLQGHRRRVNDCVSDARGRLIVSVSWDFAIKLWSGVTGEYQGDVTTDRFATRAFTYV